MSRRAGLVLGAAALMISSAVVFVSPANAAATETHAVSAAQQVKAVSTAAANCSSATSGAGWSRDATCWLDLGAFDYGKASGWLGQHMELSLSEDYTLSFTISVNPALRATASTKAPGWGGGYFESGGYAGIGSPTILYQTVDGANTTVKLSDISVTGGSGGVDFTFVSADAESTDAGESIAWSSNYSLRRLSPLGNACGNALRESYGWGSTSLTCTGTNAQKSGTAVVGVDNPSWLDVEMQGNGLQGVAFGILFSSVQANSEIASNTRAFPNDDVTVSVARDGSSLGSSTTGPTKPSATTGAKKLLRGSTTNYRFAVAPTANSLTDLGGYSIKWSCVRNGVAETPSGDRNASISVAVARFDTVNCTAALTSKPRSLSVALAATDSNGNALNADDVRVGDRISYTVTVTNTGELPYDSRVPAKVSNELSALLDDAALVPNSLVGQDAALTGSTIGWTGQLPVRNSTARFSYSVDVNGNSDRVLANLVRIVGSDRVVSSTIRLPKLTVAIGTDARRVPLAGEKNQLVTFTASVSNEGPGRYTAARPAFVAIDLSDVLDDASLVGASENTTRSGAMLRWSGPLEVGQSTTIEYTVAYTGVHNEALLNRVYGSDDAIATLPACEIAHCASLGLFNPELTVVKTASQHDDPQTATKGGVGVTATFIAGQPLFFFYTVTNTGNVPLANLHVADDKGIAVACPVTTLDIGESAICRGTSDMSSFFPDSSSSSP